ncbi:MAG TPA: hypothetical protein VFP80_05630, partial [Thermoanaerobaculia bacterium]|nr:hypothetical protein [Thermoanaerobaculia bacterium]
MRGTGVHVRTQWSEKTKSAPPKTPTLAPLRGFPARGASGHQWKSFDDFFRAGAFEDAALIAVRGKARPKAKLAQEFPRLWRRAPPANRVFIAFSRRDAAAANAVRRALEGKGYVCFTYIHGQTREPWANAVEVGRYFREAGNHLVIDSRAARASQGVRLEAHALARPEAMKAAKAAKAAKAKPPPAKQGRAGDPCCRVCYYLNGRLVGCDPV